MSPANNHVIQLKYWLVTLKKDPRLTPQQFSALEKFIMLALATFKEIDHQNNVWYNSATDIEEPMEID